MEEQKYGFARDICGAQNRNQNEALSPDRIAVLPGGGGACSAARSMDEISEIMKFLK